MTIEDKKMIPLSCPLCSDFMAVNDNDGILLLCQHIADRNKDRINLEIAHNTYAIIKRLVEMIAKQSSNNKAMIPLSVVDALILDFQTNGYRNNYDTKDVRDILEMIKKQAIPSPSELQIEKPTHEQEKPVQEQGLEQKIKDRIAELESNVPMAGWGIEKANEIRLARIDELRKLLK